MVGKDSVIRLATHWDFEAIDAFDLFAGSRRQEADDGRLLVWDSGSQVVAYITIASVSFHNCPYIEFLCVHQEHRRQGIASALLSRMEDNYRGRRVLISTEADNSAMLSLLSSRRYQYSGALAGLNRDGIEEVFFFKDIPA